MSSTRIAVVFALGIILALPSQGWAASTETVLHSFRGFPDEGVPYSTPIFDSQGNLYGTTCGQDTNEYGTVFESSPAAFSSQGAPWATRTLYIFTGATDGSCPRAGLVMDTAGNLYGTTYGGGNLNYCGGLGCGTVFELSKRPNGTWKESVLYAFTNGPDGGHPQANVILDKQGNLYGTAVNGGPCCGVVFELTKGSDGKWGESVLQGFGTGAEGEYPYGGLILDTHGNLYGTASQGGSGSGGTVFELTPVANGWQETTLYNFTDGLDGGIPVAGLTMDSEGNLYGTVLQAMAGGEGGVFELTDNAGVWTETVLYSFQEDQDGGLPMAGVTFGRDGNLYGTTSLGGPAFGEGGVYQLTPSENGWSEIVLYTFTGSHDGGMPEAGVVLDKAGNLYGTATSGGSTGRGCIYRVRSSSDPLRPTHLR
jgi:uncharacterized repeat protein (TIGR03803 family)